MTKQVDEFEREGLRASKAQSGELHEMLHRDHEQIRDLFSEIEKSNSKQIGHRQELFAKLERELHLHMEAEERFFYTALEPDDEARPRVLISYEEHQVAKMVIGAFNSLAVDDERWPAKLRVLGQLVRQHMDDEEQELFGLSDKVLGREQLQVILTRVKDLKRDAKKV